MNAKVEELLSRTVITALLVPLLLLSFPAVSPGQDAATTTKTAWLLTIDDVIGPATADYVTRGLEEAADNDAQFVILRMDTPGGLDLSMRSIIQGILSSPVPVIGFVEPSGSRAASAGTYILYATHVAAMAPATNLGAATPVQLGAPGLPQIPEGEGSPDKQQAAQPKSAMEKKILNDAEAYIESLAELRGRNKEWAARAVREGVSLSATEALQQNVIDLMADNVDDLLRQLNGRRIEMENKTVVLNTDDISINRTEPDWRSDFLAVITNPNVAYILMLVGIYGLIIEFSHPGLGGPGIIGAICLLLALYAFQVLPISYVGLGLIIVGIALMVAEAFTPSFGVMGVGGLVAFFIGSIVLMDTKLPAYQIALPIVLGFAVASGGILILILGMLIRATRKKVVSGLETVLDQIATVEQVENGRALVRLQGELWQARCTNPLQIGDEVRVKEARGVFLTVDKL